MTVFQPKTSSIQSGDRTDITIVAEADDGDVTVRVSGVAEGTTAKLELRDCDGCDEEGRTLLTGTATGTEFTINSDDDNFPEMVFSRLG